MPTTGMIIRTARQDDLSSIYDLYMHNSVHPFMAFDPMSKTDFMDTFSDLQSGSRLLVAEENRVVIGVCKVVPRAKRLRHVAYLGSMAVMSTRQGQGIGTNMMQQILSQLKEEGFKRIEVFVACDNVKTIAFLEKFGFEIEGTMKKFFSRAGSDKYFDEHIMAFAL